MRWVQSEYALKGLFLGLLLYTAVQIQIVPKPAEGVVLSPEEQRSLEQLPWENTGRIALYMLAGLGAALVLGLARQIGDFARMVKKPHAFLLFLLLENPLLIYVGLIGGLGFGAAETFEPGEGKPNLIVLSIGGAILGYGYSQLRDIQDLRYRLALSIAVGAGVVYALVMWLEDFHGGDFLKDAAKRQMLGIDILLGLPFFYLLCFVGIAEESEAEIAGLCTMLGFALYLVFPTTLPAATILVPVGIYYTYVMYVLPGLRVFKHTLRGYIYMQVGKLRRALEAFRRALELDPSNQLAHQGMDALHSSIEFDRTDAATLNLLDPNRCLAIVQRLLSRAPSPEQARKATHLINLVERQWPKLISQLNYCRAVMAVHARDLDKACELLTDLLNPEGWFANDSARKAILFDAWQLVLLVHPALKERVGEPQLAQPGRRMEAIGAVERQLAAQPNDSVVLEFRQSLYSGLQENELVEAAKSGPPADFSYHYAEELGMALIANPDQWQRGAQFLRMAAAGQPLRRPSIYQRLAEAYGKAGETLQASKYLRQVRDVGVDVGAPNLPADQRTIYFTTVKRLADEAAAQKDYDEAIYDYSLYTQFEGSGKETRRALAEMHEGKKAIFEALRFTETGLVYDKTDADLLQKKDKYYYSLEPEVLARVNQEDDRVRKFFDVDYCVKKAKSLLDGRSTDLDLLDWADHLIKLALVMQPKNMVALVQKARIHLRRGEREEGLRILEDIREMKPESSEESEAWYFVHKQLGKLYLDELNRADLAMPVFLEYLNHVGSGAETHFDLGRAYEATGDKANAIKHYRMVTAYEGHPLVWEAEQAIRRLKGE